MQSRGKSEGTNFERRSSKPAFKHSGVILQTDSRSLGFRSGGSGSLQDFMNPHEFMTHFVTSSALGCSAKPDQKKHVYEDFHGVTQPWHLKSCNVYEPFSLSLCALLWPFLHGFLRHVEAHSLHDLNERGLCAIVLWQVFRS